MMDCCDVALLSDEWFLTFRCQAVHFYTWTELRSFETSVSNHPTTRRHIAQELNPCLYLSQWICGASPNRSSSVYKNASLLLMQCSADVSAHAKRLQVYHTELVDQVWILKHKLQVQGLTYDVGADMNIDAKTDVKWNCREGMDWIYPPLDRDMWRILMDVEMRFSMFHALICVTFVKNEQNARNSTGVYFHFDIFTYMFRPVILPSSGWHFCVKTTGWSNVSDYPRILKSMWSYEYLYYLCRCTVQFVIYLTNTPTNAHV